MQLATCTHSIRRSDDLVASRENSVCRFLTQTHERGKKFYFKPILPSTFKEIILVYFGRILRVLCRDMKLSADVDFKQLARKTNGYVGADLSGLANAARGIAVDRLTSFDGVTSLAPTEEGDQLIVMADFLQAMKEEVQASILREGFATAPDVTWDDVGALAEAREELHDAIIVS